jgi:hypothetical protein
MLHELLIALAKVLLFTGTSSIRQAIVTHDFDPRWELARHTSTCDEPHVRV